MLLSCSRCNEEKDENDFNKQNRPSNRHRNFRKSICKKCDSLANEERYKKKWPEIMARAEKWNKDPKNQEKIKENKKRWAQK